jgi:hypothetical protein
VTEPGRGVSQTFGVTEDEKKIRVMNELRAKYLCEPHTTKSGRETYCYPNPIKPDVHYVLAVQDFGLWATEIVSQCTLFHCVSSDSFSRSRIKGQI